MVNILGVSQYDRKNLTYTTKNNNACPEISYSTNYQADPSVFASFKIAICVRPTRMLRTIYVLLPESLNAAVSLTNQSALK